MGNTTHSYRSGLPYKEIRDFNVFSGFSKLFRTLHGGTQNELVKTNRMCNYLEVITITGFLEVSRRIPITQTANFVFK